MKLLAHRVDAYKGVFITDPDVTQVDARGPPRDVGEFESRLWASMSDWRRKGLRGVWLKIVPEASHLIPIAQRAGFSFHRADPEYLMMTAWLPDGSENKLPPAPSHFVGVGGWVTNSKNQVLVVKEVSGPSARLEKFWKLPGGLVDRHEDLKNAAVREIFEECGIETSFEAIATIQEVHHFSSMAGPAREGTTDLYCVCVLSPVAESDSKIVVDPEEISEAKWMDIDEFLSLPFYAAQKTIFHDCMRIAASVSRRRDSGLVAKSLDLGFAPVQQTLYVDKASNSKL